jgi:toxin ParE1/3/4
VKPVTFHSVAEKELSKATSYYERQREGLGSEFRREFEAALAQVCHNPNAYAVQDESGVRYCPLHRFPYTLVYVEVDDEIWIAAVAHQHRRPRYWARRRRKRA